MQVRSARRLAVVATLVLAAMLGGVGLAPGATSASRWAAADAATIHPGVMTFTPVGQCTANFVFFQGPEVYLGQAAHCAGTGASTDTDGCASGSLPLGTRVHIAGATRPGTMVYSSWLAMRDAGEQDPFACAYNDFALVRIDPADHGRVNPSVPHWGGPTGMARDGIGVGLSIYSVGNSQLRGGSILLQPKVGLSLGTVGDGWTHPAYQLLPGIPGDSGSALLNARGQAAGLLSTLMITPLPLSNNFSDMSHVFQYARHHGFPNLLLALGTAPFTPNKLPLG